MAMTPAGDRATYRSKLELFNQRADLQLPTSVAPEELENISFYCFGASTPCKGTAFVNANGRK